MIINYDKLLKLNPFSFSISKKEFSYFKLQKKITKHHLLNCIEYKNISKSLFKNFSKIKTVEDIPYLHANLFKKYNLRSIPQNKNELVMQSSGTTNQIKSKINLDFKNSILQSKVLEKIIFDFIPRKIDTIVIIDKKDSFYNRNNFSAKNAAIRGFSQFFKNKIFLLNKDNQINQQSINYIKKKDGLLYFGFTSVIWDKFLKFFLKKKITNHKNSFLVHGGGWKKLADLNINRKKLNDHIFRSLGINKIHNYYGMVEQTGSIFMECENGYYHPSIFSEIIIRDEDLNIQKKNKNGLIQVMSILPSSYPGHNILTEDIGRIVDFDNCACGRKGKFFEVIGRVKNTELRGCSDAR